MYRRFICLVRSILDSLDSGVDQHLTVFHYSHSTVTPPAKSVWDKL